MATRSSTPGFATRSGNLDLYVKVKSSCADERRTRHPGFGEDLPKGAALEWRDWILSRNSMWDTIPAEELKPYTTFAAPMRFFRFTDDPWASDIATSRMAAAFTSASSKQIVRISPSDVGGAPIGHLGFFRQRFATTLWPRAFAWLDGEA